MTERQLFVKTLSGLRPENDAAKDALFGIPVGSIVATDISRPRNLKHHRLYWKLCSTIAESIGAQSSNISDVLKIRTGHVTIVQTKSERYRLPRSISFAKMSQDEFNTFFAECTRVICEEFLPHMKPSDLTKEIAQMVGTEAA